MSTCEPTNAEVAAFKAAGEAEDLAQWALGLDWRAVVTLVQCEWRPPEIDGALRLAGGDQ